MRQGRGGLAGCSWSRAARSLEVEHVTEFGRGRDHPPGEAGLHPLPGLDGAPYDGRVKRVPLAIGVTPWLFGNGGIAESLVEQAERAEQLGFHSIWLPEHHFGGSGSIPSPLLLLAAVAARTERLRLGTTSFLLPLRHPLHVAEEVSVLDRLSHGRVILGVGRGFRKSTFAAFDVPVKEKRDRFEAAVAVMYNAWAGEPVAWDEDGAGAPSQPVRLAPRPVQKPHPPLWVAAFGPKAVAQAGRLGLPYLASPIEPRGRLEANHARHREACQEAGLPPPAIVPIMRTVFASRDAGVLGRARDALSQQSAALSRARPSALRRAADAAIDDWACVGEPAQVADEIAQYRETFGMTHLVARAQIPGVERSELEGSLELLAALGE
jgi:alkanesulfonate monooxygenase SsuD/methylene tetrahydromethanopterin reductase-like flavin-dependent oxidoreductase (luciferase family)